MSLRLSRQTKIKPIATSPLQAIKLYKSKKATWAELYATLEHFKMNNTEIVKAVFNV